MQRVQLLVLSLMIAGTSIDASAQPPDTLWTQTYDLNYSDFCRAVLPADDSGFYLIGATKPFLYDSDLWLLKVDQNGLLESNKTFGGSENDFGESAQRTLDGGMIVTGWTYSFGSSGSDLWLLKLDSSMNEEWSVHFGDPINDYGYSVQQTSNGGYIAVGSLTAAGRPDLYIVKTDASGVLQWEKTYGEVENEEAGYSVKQTSDGGFIIAGYSRTFGGFSDLWLVKTDYSGNIEWEETYGDSSLEEVGYTVLQTGDGGYVAVGFANSYQDGSDVLILKTDDMGNLEWLNTYGWAHDDQGNDARQTMDGGFIIAGSSNPINATSQCLVMKTDPQGNLQWNCILGDEDHNEYGYSVMQLTDGGYIVGADTYAVSSTECDMLLIRLEPPAGIWGNPQVESGEVVISSIVPNPCIGAVAISFSLPQAAQTQVSVYDVTGRTVRTLNQSTLPEGENSISWDGFDTFGSPVPSGMYLVRLESMGQETSCKLMLLQ